MCPVVRILRCRPIVVILQNLWFTYLNLFLPFVRNIVWHTCDIVCYGMSTSALVKVCLSATFIMLLLSQYQLWQST